MGNKTSQLAKAVVNSPTYLKSYAKKQHTISLPLLRKSNSSKNSKKPTYFSVFINERSECKLDDSCDCVHRIIYAMKYYQSLVAVKNEEYQEEVIVFVKEIYGLLLNDYIHLIIFHSKSIDKIYTKMKAELNIQQCEFAKCQSAIRHNRDRTHRTRNDEHSDTKVDDNLQFIFFRDVLDSCHCYLFHLYEAGLRIKFSNIKHLKDDEKDPHFDCIVAQIQKILKQTVAALDKLEHFNFDRYQSKKFDLRCNVQNKAEEANELNETTKRTFMDGMYDYINEFSVEKQQISAMMKYFTIEEYDSDAFTSDIWAHDIKESNIKLWLQNDHQSYLLRNYIYQIKMDEHSFKIGYTFYYWDYYKTLDVSYQYQQMDFNIIDYSLYSPKQLYVAKKYDNLKDEILQNTIHRLRADQFNLSMMKAKKYLLSEKAKTITALKHRLDDPYHYCIEKKTPLSGQNILSVSLYTDWTELSARFSETFRSKWKYETLSSVKKCHQQFVNWGKLLRETVEYFGNTGTPPNYDSWSAKKKRMVSCESGPFYCGLSFLMVIPEFNIRLNAPTSTTKQVAVAHRFAKHDGITVQLNNNGCLNSFQLTTWNCSWMSCFNEEDERVWIGGQHPMRIEAVTVMSTSFNYHQYLRSFFYFDCMITGVAMSKDFKSSDITDADYLLLCNLRKLKMRLTKHGERYPKYIQDTFDAYTDNKKQLVIHIGLIEAQFAKLKPLIMNRISSKIRDLHVNTSFKMDGNTTSNLLKATVFDLFPHLKSIIFISTANASIEQDMKEYEIDILALLSTLERCNTSNDLSITIRAMHKYKVTGVDKYGRITCLEHIDVSWLGALWKKSSELLQATCKSTKWNVSFKSDVMIPYSRYVKREDQLFLKSV